MNIRENLSASRLFKLVKAGFEKIKDWRADNQAIALADAPDVGLCDVLAQRSLLAGL